MLLTPSLFFTITKAHVKFQSNWISSFLEKGEQTRLRNRQINIAYYDVDWLHVPAKSG